MMKYDASAFRDIAVDGNTCPFDLRLALRAAVDEAEQRDLEIKRLRSEEINWKAAFPLKHAISFDGCWFSCSCGVKASDPFGMRHNDGVF